MKKFFTRVYNYSNCSLTNLLFLPLRRGVSFRLNRRNWKNNNTFDTRAFYATARAKKNKILACKYVANEIFFIFAP